MAPRLWRTAAAAALLLAGAVQARAQTGADGALAALDAGLAARMQAAARNLAPGGDRLEATRALDAARRLARVEHGLAGCGLSFGEPLQAVEAARHALQMGDPAGAATVLRQESGALAQARRTAVCRATPAAVGKLVVNARGERLGRLTALDPASGAATLKTGGVVDLFGFLDAGNASVAVRADRLVEGRRLVVLAEDVTPAELIRCARP